MGRLSRPFISASVRLAGILSVNLFFISLYFFMHGFGFWSGFLSVGFIPLGIFFQICFCGTLCGIKCCVEILHRCKSMLSDDTGQSGFEGSDFLVFGGNPAFKLLFSGEPCKSLQIAQFNLQHIPFTFCFKDKMILHIKRNLDFLKFGESGCFRWHNRSWRYLWLRRFCNFCFKYSFGNFCFWWLMLGYYFLSRSCSNICVILCFYNCFASVLFFQSFIKQFVFQFSCSFQYIVNQKYQSVGCSSYDIGKQFRTVPPCFDGVADTVCNKFLFYLPLSVPLWDYSYRFSWWQGIIHFCRILGRFRIGIVRQPEL